MELLDKNLEKLKDVWKGEDDRQNAKITLVSAMMVVPELTMQQVQSILDELDRILDTSVEDAPIKRDTAL